MTSLIILHHMMKNKHLINDICRLRFDICEHILENVYFGPYSSGPWPFESAPTATKFIFPACTAPPACRSWFLMLTVIVFQLFKWWSYMSCHSALHWFSTSAVVRLRENLLPKSRMVKFLLLLKSSFCDLKEKCCPDVGRSWSLAPKVWITCWNKKETKIGFLNWPSSHLWSC